MRRPPAHEEVGIADLQAKMQAGSLTSRALTQAYLDRIAAIDDAGPTPNSMRSSSSIRTR